MVFCLFAGVYSSFGHYVGIYDCQYISMRFFVFLAVLLVFAFTTMLTLVLALLAITLVVVAILVFAFLLTVMIPSIVAAILTYTAGIAIMYDHCFVDIRFLSIATVASNRHVDMHFPGIAGRFLCCGSDISICN